MGNYGLTSTECVLQDERVLEMDAQQYECIECY